jgi:hypothetical protein
MFPMKVLKLEIILQPFHSLNRLPIKVSGIEKFPLGCVQIKNHSSKVMSFRTTPAILYGPILLTKPGLDLCGKKWNELSSIEIFAI